MTKEHIKNRYDKGGRYQVADRIIYLLTQETIKINTYCEKFEVSRRSLFRDFQYVALCYNCEFLYNHAQKLYIKQKNEFEDKKLAEKLKQYAK